MRGSGSRSRKDPGGGAAADGERRRRAALRALDRALEQRDYLRAANLLVWRFGDEIRQFSVKVAGNVQDGEDLAQEVLSSACSSLRRFSGRSSVRTWLYAVAWNKVADHRKRQVRRPDSISLDDDPPSETDLPEYPPQEEALETAERARLLALAIERLSPRDQRILTLRVQMGLPYREIARVTGTGVGAAKMRMSRAVQRLRQAVQDSGTPPSTG